ncbi:MAG: DUF1003 domain-containing protein [Candidatus Pacebacteria bacterium]|nr:DUF1003 domain-containing protein [Candidatus Paceibacterota bacterium]
MRRTDIEHKEKLSILERVAVAIARRIGSANFFLVLICITVSWLGWNILAPVPMRFDPYPAFVLWLFIVNVFQLMMLPLLMISQNLNGRHSDARAEADFEINTKAEFEIEVVLQHLENQNAMILQILERLEHKK